MQSFLSEEDGAVSGRTTGVEEGGEACKELVHVKITLLLRLEMNLTSSFDKWFPAIWPAWNGKMPPARTTAHADIAS